MPRPRTIPPHKRLRIFLDYRLKASRILPVAKAHGVSRSAVRAIVDEFIREGFTHRPRASLSPALLLRLQDRHLVDVLSRLRTSREGFSVRPPEDPWAGLTTEEGPHMGARDIATEGEPSGLDDALLWHIRGTQAEKELVETRHAVDTYLQRCRSLWSSIRCSLKEQAGFSVEVQKEPRTPHLFPSLVGLIHQEVFRRARGGSPIDPSETHWMTSEGAWSVLSMHFGDLVTRIQVAYGTAKDHEIVKQSLGIYLAEQLGPMVGEAQELMGLHGDLRYLESIAREALARVTEGEVRQCMCPACPYPEILVISSQDKS